MQTYYNNTPNEENRNKQLTLYKITSSDSSSLDSSIEKNSKSSATTEPKVFVDAIILMHALDLLSTLLKKTDRAAHPEEFKKIIELFPTLLSLVHKSDDMFLQLHGTTALKNFIFYGHQEILLISQTDAIIETAKKLLSPLTNETAAVCLGNLVI